MSRQTKKRIGIILMMLGIGLMAYPCLSFMLNDLTMDRHMAAFEERATEVTAKEVAQLEQLNADYRNAINESGGSIVDPWAVQDYQERVLDDYAGDRIFGYVSIPKLDIYEPLYLGAGEGHLADGVAHLEGTALPLGGKGSRCVIAGHRGGYRNSPKFLYIDRLSAGDFVYLYVQNRRLTYRVDGQDIILPSDNEKLAPLADKDMLTLLTCHPFPLNSQRLLVNAQRVEEKVTPVTPGLIAADREKVSKDPLTRYTAYAVYFFLAMLFLVFFYLVVKLVNPNFTLRKRKSVHK